MVLRMIVYWYWRRYWGAATIVSVAIRVLIIVVVVFMAIVIIIVVIVAVGIFAKHVEHVSKVGRLGIIAFQHRVQRR